MPARFDRRWFLAGLAATAAACSGRGRPRAAGSISVANFPFYIDAATNPGFTAATGIAVEYHEEIDDEDIWFANVAERVAAKEAFGRDVVVVSDWMAARLARRGLALDAPHAKTVWALGMIGIAYDERATGRALTGVADLFAPDLHGRVALPHDPRAAIGAALLADGVDPSGATLDEIDASAGRLANSVRVGQVQIGPGPPFDAVLAGDAAAAIVRASDAVGVEATRPEIRFVVPAEGGLRRTDVAVITTTAANADGAVRYLAYVTDPDHAAERFRSVPAIWDDDRVTTLLRAEAPDVVADPLRNPPAEVRSRLRSFRWLDDAGEQRLASAFAGVLAGGR